MKNLNTETLSPTETIFLENDIALTDTLSRNKNETIKSKNGFIIGYLIYICKRQCGKTASDIINQHMIKDIVTLLHDTRKSIKEISNRNKLLQEAEQIIEKNDVVIF